jgi:succinate-acetate transporter protein
MPLSIPSKQDFYNYGNSVWLVIITICTVGYGEIYPKSAFGRTVAIVACFWGVFVVSLFVVTLNNILIFTQAEENAFNLLRRLELREKIKDRAQLTVSAALR